MAVTASQQHRGPPAPAAADEGGSAAFGRIIADNARERRTKAKALRDQGRSNEYVLWPSSSSTVATTEAHAKNVASSSFSSTASTSTNTSERTAHLLLRVLCLCFVVPLSRLGEEGQPEKLVQHGCTVDDALDTLEQMMEVRPDLLDDVFASRPGTSKMPVASTSRQQLTSTTFDLWICPRLLATASVLTLRTCGILPISDSNQQDSDATLAARRQASALRTKMLAAIKKVLRTSLLKTNHLESVRAMLWETLKVALRALSRSEDAVPSIGAALLPSSDDEAEESGASSRPILSFFEDFQLPLNSYLTRPKRKPFGDGIARLWLAEDHTPYSCDWASQSPAELHSLVQSYILAACDICLDLAREFPQTLADVGSAAGKLLVETWSKDAAYRRAAELPCRRVGAEIQAVRLEMVARCLESGHGLQEVVPLPCVVDLVVAEMGAYLGTAATRAQGDWSVALGQALRKALLRLRLIHPGASRCPSSTSGISAIHSQAWTEIRHLAPTLISEMASPLPALDGDREAQGGSEAQLSAEDKKKTDDLLARKLCAFEATLILIGHSPAYAGGTAPPTSQHERDFLRILCGGENTEAFLAEDCETALDEEEGGHDWLTQHELNDARRMLQGMHQQRKHGSKGKRKRGQGQQDVDDEEALVSCPDVERFCSLAGVDEQDIWAGEDIATATSEKSMEMAGQLICVRAGTMHHRRYTTQFYCEVSDGADQLQTQPPTASKTRQEEAARLVTWLRSITSFEAFRQLGLIEYARHAVAHSDDETFLQMTSAVEAALQATFPHQAREIRLAAGRLAFAYVARHCRIELGDEAVRPLRARLSAVLSLHRRCLEPTSRIKTRETTIISLGGLGKLKAEEVQREALLALVLELNGTVLLQSCAYLQITGLAAYHRCSTYALLSPHFAAISPPIVERMTSAPGLFLEVLQLTNQNQAKFLQATIAFTLPVIIASKNIKALNLMVSALGTTVPKLCLEQAPAILKNYLLLLPDQRDRNIATYLDTIKRASDHDVALRQLYRSYNGEILGHLTATLGDPERRKVAIEGLRHIEHTLKTQPPSSASNSSPVDASRRPKALGSDLSAFLKDEILGILAWLNDDLMSVNGKKSPSFKAMVARSIGVFIDIVGQNISLVAPQIMATLSSTLQVPELRLATLQSWQTFMTTLKYEEAGGFIGQTAAALLSVWTQFTGQEKKVAKEILRYLVVDNATEMRDHIEEIPNLDCKCARRNIASELWY